MCMWTLVCRASVVSVAAQWHSLICVVSPWTRVSTSALRLDDALSKSLSFCYSWASSPLNIHHFALLLAMNKTAEARLTMRQACRVDPNHTNLHLVVRTRYPLARDAQPLLKLLFLIQRDSRSKDTSESRFQAIPSGVFCVCSWLYWVPR